MLALFWTSVTLIIYTYLGYPLILMALSRFRSRTVEAEKDYFPPVTLIVTVFNEEQRLKKKIANTLELDYPRDRLEIVLSQLQNSKKLSPSQKRGLEPLEKTGFPSARE